MAKPVFGFLTKRDSNQSPQLQRLASERNKFRLYTFKKVNNISANEIVMMHMLVYTFIVRTTPKTGFLELRPK